MSATPTTVAASQPENSLAHLMQSTLYTIVTVILFGLVYPVIVTILAHLFFRQQADGSLIHNQQGVVIGTALAGQAFSKPGYFHPRPSAAGKGYDPMQSGGTNLGPTSKKLIDATRATVISVMQENPKHKTPPPADLVSSSASGLDPDISPAAAAYQVSRIARARGLSEQAVQALIAQYTVDCDLSIFGEPRINVLQLNLALDAKERT